MLSTHGYVDPVPQLGRTDTGGQVGYVLQLAKAFAKQGTKVDIYTRWFDHSKKQIDPVPEYPDVNVIRIPAGPQKFIAKEEIYAVLPELAENMIEFVKKNGSQYDFFHGHYVDAGIVTLDVAKAFDKSSFFTAHSLGAWKREQMGGDPVEMEKKYNFKLRIKEELRIFKSVRAQTVTTELQREKLKELYGFSSDNVVVISPGVDVHTFCPANISEEPVDTKLPERYVFCLSRIDSNKGHDLLLKAFDLVREEIDDVHLVIGGGSPQPRQVEQQVFDSMKKIIDELSMHENVHIIGYVPDELLVPSYQHAELFVLPSIFEPFGMTALEAMACGRAVVASKFGGIKNVIVSGENGVLVDPADQKEFAAAMIELLNEPKSAEGMGLRGRETIQKSYSWEAIADKHFAFYDRFIS
jgi:mannosylfructose-phosphate synthase